jgi:hypothetical protein
VNHPGAVVKVGLNFPILLHVSLSKRHCMFKAGSG